MFAALLAALLCVAVARNAAAQDSGFFSGKTITVVVGYSAGGGYDQYARMLARHLGRHIPGNPTIVVRNMPGAASLTAVRYLSTTAPKDGTVITVFDPGLVLESRTWPDKFNVNFSDYQWLGSMSRDVNICYSWHATGIASWDDLMRRREFLIGVTAKGSAVYFSGVALRRIFNAPVRQIAGYPGSNEQRLAVERGELEGACASWSAIPEDWIAHGKINVLARFAPQRPDDMPASAPYVNDLAKTKEQKDLLDLLNAPGQLGRPFIVAREVSRERMQILSTAFAETLKDQTLLAEARKQSLPIDLIGAEESEKIVRMIYSAPPDLVQKVKDMIE
jgi:tripartite-type tricarboxylate transporter receptor subunit TctC